MAAEMWGSTSKDVEKSLTYKENKRQPLVAAVIQEK